MSKKFKIAKRVNHYDIEDFEDVEIEDDFIDENMVQIISDNEYDPMYDDCETIAVALQLAGYGKVADLEAKLAESEKRIELADCIIKQYADKDKNLYLQLAEKDKQILELQEDSIRSNQIYNKELVEKEQELEGWKDGTIVEQLWHTERQLKEKIEEIERIKNESDKNIDYLVEFASLIENEKDCNKMLKALSRVRDGNKYIIDTGKEQEINDICQHYEYQLSETGKELYRLQQRNKFLEKEIAEKNKKIREKIGKMNLNEFVKACISSGFMVSAEEKDNKDKVLFCIDRLNKAKFDALMLGGLVQGETFFINSEHYRNYIDNQIEELKRGIPNE